MGDEIMIEKTLRKSISGRRAARAGTALLAVLMIFGATLTNRPAEAGMGVGAAAATASAGVGACSNNSGKALYDCVANVLDRLNNEVTRYKIPEAQRAIQTASQQLHAATNKAQALSAISQCRAAISAIIRQSTAAGVERSGLSAITGVLAQAARLIQAKG